MYYFFNLRQVVFGLDEDEEVVFGYSWVYDIEFTKSSSRYNYTVFYTNLVLLQDSFCIQRNVL